MTEHHEALQRLREASRRLTSATEELDAAQQELVDAAIALNSHEQSAEIAIGQGSQNDR